jgi:hypothetical protein
MVVVCRVVVCRGFASGVGAGLLVQAPPEPWRASESSQLVFSPKVLAGQSI